MVKLLREGPFPVTVWFRLSGHLSVLTDNYLTVMVQTP